MKAPGTLYIIAAASGTGKTSLARALSTALPNLKLSISHTTRPARVGERWGQDYFFVDSQQFAELVAHQTFLEHATIFGYSYGTSKAWIQTQLEAGIDVILTIDWQGAQQVKRQISCVTIFLLPPSKAALRNRLVARKRDSLEVIEQRLATASKEIAHCQEFDYIIVNDKFAQALADLQALIHCQRLQSAKQLIGHAELIAELTAV